MVAYGPVFDTDCLSWDSTKNASEIEPGQFDAAAWELEEAFDQDVSWEDALEKTFQKGCVVWERFARVTMRRLRPLLASRPAAQPHASFAFGWVVPRYLASGADYVSGPLTFPEGLPIEDLIRADQRLYRLLNSAGIGEGNDASAES
jgi:hypothetical protein